MDFQIKCLNIGGFAYWRVYYMHNTRRRVWKDKQGNALNYSSESEARAFAEKYLAETHD